MDISFGYILLHFCYLYLLPDVLYSTGLSLVVFRCLLIDLVHSNRGEDLESQTCFSLLINQLVNFFVIRVKPIVIFPFLRPKDFFRN